MLRGVQPVGHAGIIRIGHTAAAGILIIGVIGAVIRLRLGVRFFVGLVAVTHPFKGGPNGVVIINIRKNIAASGSDTFTVHPHISDLIAVVSLDHESLAVAFRHRNPAAGADGTAGDGAGPDNMFLAFAGISAGGPGDDSGAVAGSLIAVTVSAWALMTSVPGG